MRLGVLLILLLFPLVACTTPATQLEVYCPSISAYSPEFNDRLADELESLPDDASVVTALSDYQHLRDIIRQCESARN